MPKAVQLAAYGGVEQLQIVDVPKPEPGAGEVVVRVVAAGTNPGEIAIREGRLHAMFPRAFPFGQGTDFAGTVDAVGANVTAVAIGDAVLGWTEQRAAQAEYVAVPATQVVPKPPALDWYRAGSLFVVATTAVAAVRAVSLAPGDVVAVSGAAGGVGSLAIQFARRAGARVIGIASDANADFLRSVGVEPLAYGDGLAERLRALVPGGLDAFVDLFGGGYVDLAVSLGIARDRIDTIIDFQAAERHGVKAEGSALAASRETLASVAEDVAWGTIVMPLEAIYPFASVHDAYVDLARRKARGKIVLAVADGPEKPVRAPLRH
jgi:NADPH2:quinone reductase